jgi:glycerol-3-phosphate dehydrogenase
MRKISIYGIGNFGYALLKHLARKKNSKEDFILSAYDINEQLMNQLQTKGC